MEADGFAEPREGHKPHEETHLKRKVFVHCNASDMVTLYSLPPTA